MTAIDPRPETCCGKCPPILGGGYDCTCEGNPRCTRTAPLRTRSALMLGRVLLAAALVIIVAVVALTVRIPRADWDVLAAVAGIVVLAGYVAWSERVR